VRQSSAIDLKPLVFHSIAGYFKMQTRLKQRLSVTVHRLSSMERLLVEVRRATDRRVQPIALSLKRNSAKSISIAL
jgi:hypothetical protein